MDNLELLSQIKAMKYQDGLVVLVESLMRNKNHAAVDMIVTALQTSPHKSAQSNYIKVLYELGRLAPDLIEKHVGVFIELLASKNNRLVWGAMYALEAITLHVPADLCPNLDQIVEAMNQGSRITIDGGMKLLAKLASDQSSCFQAFPLLKVQLETCEAKKFPAYMEETLVCKDPKTRKALLAILEERSIEAFSASQIKRLKKVKNKLLT